jgi:hypothetical protein
MERNTFNILFYLRRSKLLKDGTVPIFMRITINGKRWDSSLQLGVDLNNWDAKKERTIGNDEGSDTINNKIESLKFRLHKIKTNIEEEGKTMTIGLVKIKFLGQEKLQWTIIQLFALFLPYQSIHYLSCNNVSESQSEYRLSLLKRRVFVIFLLVA